MYPYDDPRKRYAQYLAGTGSPYTDPRITVESQMANQLRQLDPNKLPDPRESALQQATRSTVGAQSRLSNEQAYADALRASKMPEGQRVGPSGIYTRNPYDALETAFNRAYGGYLSGKLKPKYEAIEQAEATKLEGLERLKDIRTGEEQAFDTALQESKIAAEAAEGARNRRSREDVARANQAAMGARARRGRNYVLDGKVIHAVEDQGQFRLGSTAGPVIPPEQMQRAVLYEPGAEAGTMGDAETFQRSIDETAQESANLMGNILVGDYFDKSTGFLNAERWLGVLALGPDGEMTQANQQQMMTAVMEPMAQRMREINLKPWTEKELETITKDFPGLNSKYPAWAGFTLRTIMPMLRTKFAKAIQAGRSTPGMQDQILQIITDDVIEGARKQDMDLRDLEQLGLPKEVIKEYLRRIQ